MTSNASISPSEERIPIRVGKLEIYYEFLVRDGVINSVKVTIDNDLFVTCTVNKVRDGNTYLASGGTRSSRERRRRLVSGLMEIYGRRPPRAVVKQFEDAVKHLDNAMHGLFFTLHDYNR